MGMKEVGMVVAVVLRRWWWLVMVSAVVMATMVMRWLLVAADEDVGGDCTMVVAAEEVVTRWLWGDYVVKVAAVRWEDVNEDSLQDYVKELEFALHQVGKKCEELGRGVSWTIGLHAESMIYLF
ncbi:hypothetical protein Tco_0002429 [Tanacetum coccineum]